MQKIRPRLLLLALPYLTACGALEDAADKVQQTAVDATDAVGQAMDDAGEWIEGAQLAQRQRHCSREGGQWVQRLEVEPCKNGRTRLHLSQDEGQESALQEQACDSGQGTVYEHQCVYYTSAGQVYFNDGPSQPPWIERATGVLDVKWDVGRWSSLFWPAAVNHDYCYHHNGITRGYTHKDCDEQMLADLSALCAEPRFHELDWFGVDLCKRQAAITFASVRAFGDEAWEIMNTHVDYPVWTPVWQRFNMPGDVMDAELRDQVEDFLGQLEALKP